MIVKDAEIQALARYICVLRPEWGEVGVISALRAAVKDHGWLAVQHAAVSTANDAHARTPAAIGRPELYAKPDAARPDVLAHFCPKCRRVVVPQVAHSCQPGDIQRGLSLLRSALDGSTT
jgi:hypothetical protein